MLFLRHKNYLENRETSNTTLYLIAMVKADNKTA